jgi:hypothetical protein
VVGGVLVLAVALAGSRLAGVDFGEVSRDIAVIHDAHPLTGALSMFGVLLWCAAACASLTAGLAARDVATRVRLFLFGSAALSAWLMLDDGFMIHEMIAPVHLHVGEVWVIAGLGMACAAWLACFRRVIAATRFGMLVLAFALLGASLAADLVLGRWLAVGEATGFLLEDGAKWLGIVCWFTYHLRTAVAILRDEIPMEAADDRSPRDPAQPLPGPDAAGAGQADPIARAA